MNQYFVIDGSSDPGNYNVYEVIDGEKRHIYHVNGMKKGGIKKSRQYIGNYLVSKYNYSLSTIVPHQNIKPDRQESKNPWHRNCTVQDYLDGIDPQKKLK